MDDESHLVGHSSTVVTVRGQGTVTNRRASVTRRGTRPGDLNRSPHAAVAGPEVRPRLGGRPSLPLVTSRRVRIHGDCLAVIAPVDDAVTSSRLLGSVSLGGERSRSRFGRPDRGANERWVLLANPAHGVTDCARVTPRRALSEAEPARRLRPVRPTAPRQLADQGVTFRLGLGDTSAVAQQSRIVDILVDLGKPPAVRILGPGVEKDAEPPTRTISTPDPTSSEGLQPGWSHQPRGRGREVPGQDA